ncbi:hypothetical protein [Cellulomonas sp. Y8]|uniref:hypothetical protein n=1 Tax=Cellulomonas sp. Y8 TaxID=2591145 RepID=UPI003D723E29
MGTDPGQDERARWMSSVYAARIMVRGNASAGRDSPEWLERLAQSDLGYERPFRLPRKRWQPPWHRWGR